MWGNEQAIALKSIFDVFDQNSIKWIILRNYEGLPEKNDSKDVDIAIDRKDWNKSQELIYGVLKRLGFTKAIRTKFQSIICHTFYKINNERIYTIKIDLFACYEWRGAEYINFHELYNQGMIYQGMHIPNPYHNAVMLFLKPILLGGKVKEKYRAEFEPEFETNQDQCLAVLMEILGDKIGQTALDIVKRRDYSKTAGLQKAIRKKIWFSALKKRPFLTLKGCIHHYAIEICRRILPIQNRLFAVLGPDGAGKTTFIDLFVQTLSEIIPMEREQIIVRHFRPTMLPNIKKLLKGKKYNEDAEEFTRPHRAESAGYVGSFLRLSYYWIDYMVGIPIMLGKARLHQQFIIFDRYFHDFLVDPKRSRIKLPYSVRKLFFLLVKKPKLTFVLLCDAGSIYKRKQELSEDEIEECLKKYKRILKANKIIELDASASPEQVVHQATEHLIDIIGCNI